MLELLGWIALGFFGIAIIGVLIRFLFIFIDREQARLRALNFGVVSQLCVPGSAKENPYGTSTTGLIGETTVTCEQYFTGGENPPRFLISFERVHEPAYKVFSEAFFLFSPLQHLDNLEWFDLKGVNCRIQISKGVDPSLTDAQKSAFQTLTEIFNFELMINDPVEKRMKLFFRGSRLQDEDLKMIRSALCEFEAAFRK